MNTKHKYLQNYIPGTPEYLGINIALPKYNMVDLFAGCGGLSLGLHWAGFKTLTAIESDRSAAQTYDMNFGKTILRDGNGLPLTIESASFRDLNKPIHLLVGGPPCQGFSQLGKKEISDPRNELWRQYLRALEEIKPLVFLMENVPPLLNSFEGKAFINAAEALGYKVVYKVLSAENYGVPQKRKRAFILGIKLFTFDINFPSPLLAPPKTVKWAFSGLSRVPDERDWHIGRTPTSISLERYKCIPEGGNRFDLMKLRPDITPPCWLKKKKGSTDVFGRLCWNKPSLTIRTEFYKPEKGCYLHPSEHRPITHREAARLQTFPDSFQFLGSKSDVAKQIGNAVPPLLAYHIGLQITTGLDSYYLGTPSEVSSFTNKELVFAS